VIKPIEDHRERWQTFENELQRIARRLTADRHLREDLLQEMRLAVWRLPPHKSRAEYVATARNRAIDYIRRVAHLRVANNPVSYGAFVDREERICKNFLTAGGHSL